MVLSCESKQQFDSEKWKRTGVDWQISDIREKMIDDLLDSDTLREMTYEELFDLLGLPKSKKDNQVSYLIREKYRRNIDPEYISYLVIEFNNDKQVINYWVEK